MTRHTGWYARPRYRSSLGNQFHKEHQGQEGSWFFPTVEHRQAEIAKAWQEAADAVIAKFGAGD